MNNAAEGTLGVVVSPPYIGLGNMPDETLGMDQRARIGYRAECAVHQQEWGKCSCDETQRRYIGFARCWVPKGRYSMFLFYAAPSETLPVAYKPLPHTHVQLRAGWVPIDPITHEDPLQNLLNGVTR